jgi:DNA repair protein RecO (recombination protein O)
VSTRQDQAVTLRLTEFSETSQIATLFTADHGLLRLIAKGARRSTRTRFAPGLDLLELGDLAFSPARGDARLGTLTEWRQRQAFIGLRREPLRLHAGLYAIELVAALTEEGDPHPTLFQALVHLLAKLAGPGPAEPQIPIFQTALLHAIGYLPTFDRCAACQRPPPRRGVLHFSAEAGGLLCRDCEGPYIDKQRMDSRLVGTTPETGPPMAWFTLLDYHLTQIAGQRFKTATALSEMLGRNRSRNL